MIGVVVYILVAGGLFGLAYALVRSQASTATALHSLSSQLGDALDTGTLADQPSGLSSEAEKEISQRLATVETDLAALKRDVNDIDERAEHRFRRLTARANRAEQAEDAEDAEGASDDPGEAAEILAQLAQARGPGPGRAPDNVNGARKARRRRKKPWLP